jgi:hypothetical protein
MIESRFFYNSAIRASGGTSQIRIADIEAPVFPVQNLAIEQPS